MREIEKALKRFDAPLEWLVERITMRESEFERMKQNGDIEEQVKDQMLRAKRLKSIHEVLEEVDVLIDMHFYNKFRETKSSMFLKKIIETQNWIEMNLLKKAWRTLNYSPKTTKAIREIQENLPLSGNEKNSSQRRRSQSAGAASQDGR